MNHGVGARGREPPVAPTTPPAAGALTPLARLLGWINSAVLAVSMIAIVAACCVLTSAVFLRYFLKKPTDWQDEVSVFLLVGSIFLCAAYVQSQRGHVGIEAIASLLSPRLNHLRVIFCDAASFAFCAFFAWKSWTLWLEAVIEHQTTFSSLAPPLWIPYGLLAVGTTLLALQIVVQLWAGVSARDERR